MKIIIDKPILVDVENFDFADWLEASGVDFQHSFMHTLVLTPQELCTTTEFREELFDRLYSLGVNINLERTGYNTYQIFE